MMAEASVARGTLLHLLRDGQIGVLDDHIALGQRHEHDRHSGTGNGTCKREQGCTIKTWTQPSAFIALKTACR